jgi:4-hydroxy-tetrahydrodipicolinate reductase
MPGPQPRAPLRAAVIGVTGRMGRELLRAAASFPQLTIGAAVASAASSALGRDAGELAGIAPLNIAVSADLPRALGACDVALDFSTAAATRANLAACRAARTPLLLGATGFGAELESELTAAAREIALLIAPNTSIGVAVLTELVRLAAAALPADFDLDILETHHRTKRDAPSGTALALAAVAQGVRAPGAPAPGRAQGRIGFASVRAGDVVGEHTALFSGLGEQLCLTHRASERGVFARGALAAALWLQPRPPGRYGMADLLRDKTAT